VEWKCKYAKRAPLTFHHPPQSIFCMNCKSLEDGRGKFSTNGEGKMHNGNNYFLFFSQFDAVKQIKKQLLLSERLMQIGVVVVVGDYF
jgi:hypothetical protein